MTAQQQEQIVQQVSAAVVRVLGASVPDRDPVREYNERCRKEREAFRKA